jgi:hypothetical protein
MALAAIHLIRGGAPPPVELPRKNLDGLYFSVL